MRALRRRLGVVYRGAVAALVLFAGVTTVLIDRKVWESYPKWLAVFPVLAVCVVTFIDSSWQAWRAHRAPLRAAQEADAQKTILAALVEISEKKQVSLLNLGGSVFFIHQPFSFIPQFVRSRAQWGWLQPQLRRHLRVRLTDSPQPSNVTWTMGKGAIGVCWEEDRTQHVYWLPIAVRHGSKTLTEAAFQSLPPATRAGFGYREFIAIVDKYAEIRAVPIKDGGTIVGVLSVDLARRDRTKDQGKALEGRDVVETLETAAAVVQKDRRPR